MEKNPIRGSQYPHNANYISPRLDESQLLVRNGSYRKKLARVKHLLRNNFLCQSVIKAQRTHVCGSGILAMGAQSPLRLAIWEGWSKRADVAQTKSYDLIISEIVDAMCAGDVLVVLRSIDTAATGRVSSFVDIINSGRVDTPTDFLNGINPETKNRVILGVEYNASGTEIGYWVVNNEALVGDSKNCVFVPRYNAKTGRFVSRLVRNPETAPNSVRGSSVIDSVIPEVEDFADLCDSGVRAGIVKNSLAVIMKTDRPQALADAVDASTAEDEDGVLVNVGKIPFGSVSSVPSGSEIQTISHNGNMDMVQMLQHVKHNFAAGVGRPYEILFGDYAGVNFSAGKLLHDPFWRIIRQWEKVISEFTQEIYEAVTDEGLLIIGVPPSSQSKKITSWIGSPKTDADENKSADAALKKASGGLAPISQYHAEHGFDYKDVLREYKSNIDLEYEIMGFSPSEMMLKAAPQFKHLAPVATNVEVQDAPSKGQPSETRPVGE